MKSRMSFDDWTEEEVHAFLRENTFVAFRQLPSGEWIGILPLLFTTSVCMDITPISSYSYRWCFEDPMEALDFYTNAQEYDEVPAPEKRKSLKGHRYARKPLLIENDERGFPKW